MAAALDSAGGGQAATGPCMLPMHPSEGAVVAQQEAAVVAATPTALRDSVRTLVSALSTIQPRVRPAALMPQHAWLRGDFLSSSFRLVAEVVAAGTCIMDAFHAWDAKLHVPGVWGAGGRQAAEQHAAAAASAGLGCLHRYCGCEEEDGVAEAPAITLGVCAGGDEGFRS